MIVTAKDARKMAAKYFPDTRLQLPAGKAFIIQRPRYQEALGLPGMAFQRMDCGKDSAIRVGSVIGGRIDWTADFLLPA